MSEGSGWSSWGNWISSTVSSVVETSSQVVQDLTSAVDDSEEKVTKPSGGLKLYRTDEEVKKEEEERNAPDFEDKIIQRTTDVVRDTSNLVSSLFQVCIDHEFVNFVLFHNVFLFCFIRKE